MLDVFSLSTEMPHALASEDLPGPPCSSWGWALGAALGLGDGLGWAGCGSVHQALSCRCAALPSPSGTLPHLHGNPPPRPISWAPLGETGATAGSQGLGPRVDVLRASSVTATSLASP